MPTIELRAQISVEDLLAGVEQLPTPYLEEFVAKALGVQAKRRAPSLSGNESQLLQRINRTLPADQHTLYIELDVKRRDELLSPADHQELLDLITQIEQLDAERIVSLAN